MIGWMDIVLRLGAATLIGGMLGLNREMHHKHTGVRTLGLVGLGSAIAVLAVADDPQADVSRVIQGVITGIGFLGAGVILHHPTEGKVHGLTTAATIWVTASLGMLCGLASWRTLTVAVLLTMVLLTIGGPFEKWCKGRLSSEEPPAPGESDQRTGRDDRAG
jgi:putative Mg2+ transporter-C (MgtC) family protein